MKYFTLENLNDFLKWMENTKPFSSYEVTRRDAGLELFKIDPEIRNNQKVMAVNPFKQGRYYYCNEPIDIIEFGTYEATDSRVMGESMIQFKTGKNSTQIIPDNTTAWNWTSELGLKPNSLYQIHFTSDQSGVCFAHINKFETCDVEDVVGRIGSVYVEMSYIVNEGKEFSPVSNEWIKKTSSDLINNVLFAPRGDNYTSVDFSTLKKTNKLIPASGNPRVIIEFKEAGGRDIDLSDLLKNTNFDTFKIKMSASRIASMTGMFRANTNNSSASLIDLTGITESTGDNFAGDNMFVSMFSGRRIKDSNESKLKLFGKDENGNATGINTSKAKSLAGMFENGPLNNSHKDIINNINIELCNNFSSMFSGCYISEINLDSWTNGWDEKVWRTRNSAYYNTSVNMNFSNMFSRTNITDSSLNSISRFIENSCAYGKNTSSIVNNYYFDNMFDGCTQIVDGSKIKLYDLFDYNYPSFNFNMNDNDDSWKMYISFMEMFANCSNLNETPIIILKGVQNIDSNKNIVWNQYNLYSANFEGMFRNAGKSRNNISFSNISEWIFDYANDFNNNNYWWHRKGQSDSTSNDTYYRRNFMFDSMFEGVPLYKSNTQNLSFLKTGEVYGIMFSANFERMFANTSNDNYPYNLYINLRTFPVVPDGTIVNNEDKFKVFMENELSLSHINGITSSMLDSNNKGTTYVLCDYNSFPNYNEELVSSMLYEDLLKNHKLFNVNIEKYAGYK